MTFRHGDRVRWLTMADDGFPLVRYGFVGGTNGNGGPVMVMLDGELKGDAVDPAQLETVAVTTVELHLDGEDLLGDAALRAGLVRLWEAEAESAGLDVSPLQGFGDGWLGGDGRWTLAELVSGGQRYFVRAHPCPTNPDVTVVRADPA
jgi:hypothetical protein